MGIQLIFIVETNKKCNSDWIYIRETIDEFFEYNKSHTKFTPIYMDGRAKYSSKEKEIYKYIKQYSSTSKDNKSYVIYCFDCDNYNTDISDRNFLDTAKSYCDRKNYKFAWFCKDIENVYLGKQINDNQKTKCSVQFKANKRIKEISKNKLEAENYTIGRSNILNIIGEFLQQK